MSVNSMSFEQSATLLNELRQQVTGQKSAAPVNNGEFVSVGTPLLQNGYDPIINAITQMVSRTIFSIRPFSRKFPGLRVSEQRYGAITRKLNIADKPFEDNQAFELVDGQSIDQYKVDKPNILQTNFYGATMFAKKYTIFRDQLNSAFSGPDQFAEFMTMVTQNTLDMIEQAHESMARLTLNNFILGKSDANNGVINVITEYNADTHSSVTAQTVYEPANFPNFIRWLYARIATLTTMMTERTGEYQIQVTGKEVMRHTPLSRQKVYMMAPLLNEINARVLADAYHTDFLRISDVEGVNFWQAFDTPDTITGKPTYLATDGTLTPPASDVTATDVIGVIFDEEALGYTVVNQSADVTPFNAAGDYWNTYYKFVDKYWKDFTEKGIILKIA